MTQVPATERRLFWRETVVDRQLSPEDVEVIKAALGITYTGLTRPEEALVGHRIIARDGDVLSVLRLRRLPGTNQLAVELTGTNSGVSEHVSETLRSAAVDLRQTLALSSAQEPAKLSSTSTNHEDSVPRKSLSASSHRPSSVNRALLALVGAAPNVVEMLPGTRTVWIALAAASLFSALTKGLVVGFISLEIGLLGLAGSGVLGAIFALISLTSQSLLLQGGSSRAIGKTRGFVASLVMLAMATLEGVMFGWLLPLIVFRAELRTDSAPLGLSGQLLALEQLVASDAYVASAIWAVRALAFFIVVLPEALRLLRRKSLETYFHLIESLDLEAVAEGAYRREIARLERLLSDEVGSQFENPDILRKLEAVRAERIATFATMDLGTSALNEWVGAQRGQSESRGRQAA